MEMLTRQVARLVEGKLGGYRQQVNRVDTSLPVDVKKGKKVAVIGAGLAGLRAASLLAERGFKVILIEKNNYLGGKVGAWPITLSDGSQVSVEHGFHAFFRHYYNLDRFLGDLGVKKTYRAIEDYLVLTREGGEYTFADINTTPVINILSMLDKKVYTLSDILLNPRLMRLASLLQYHPEKTFEKYDHVSFEKFARDVRLPRGLQLTFNSFARAFFAPPSKMSMAEVIKSFHFYFLSNDAGLLYDYPDDDYSVTLLDPLRKRLEKHGAEILMSKQIGSIRPTDGGYLVGRRKFDYVVLAADVKGTRTIAERSDALAEKYPTLTGMLRGLRSSNRYAVLRLWTDRDMGRGIPGFVITDHDRVLDSISFYHRLEKSSADWAQKNGGGIYELHSYSVPDEVDSEAEIRKRFLNEFQDYFPESKGMHILDEHLQVRDDFTAFHTGMYAGRPEVETEASGLFLAGDWVKLPRPAMLMEAACMSGLMAANCILRAERLREEEVFSVPPYGVLARP